MHSIKITLDETNEAEYLDLCKELKTMIHLGEHPNVVNLIGACTIGKLILDKLARFFHNV